MVDIPLLKPNCRLSESRLSPQIIRIMYSNSFNNWDAPAMALYESDYPGSFRPPLKIGKKAQLRIWRETVPCTMKDRKIAASKSNIMSGACRKTSLEYT